jgi:hypothetical protein
MTELPINMFNNKQNNKSRSFKAHQQKFKRQEKQTDQISSLPKKIQKVIKSVTKKLVKEPKPKQPKIPKKQKSENSNIQNMLDETYEGEEDAYVLLEEISIQLHWEAYQAYIEELDEKMRIEDLEEELQQKKKFEDDFDLENNFNFWENYEDYESEDKMRNPHLYVF